MLIADTISEVSNTELPMAMAQERVRMLGSIEVNAEILTEVVETITKSADREAAQAVQGISGLLDCCGTGGSGLPHFNTSTTVAFVLAAAGVQVAKFGNRGSTSLSGSFDLLESLGLPCYVRPAYFKEIIQETNLVFLFAQQFYPALKKLAPVRQAVGIRTVFNLVGPLLNPTQPQFRLMGVPKPVEQEAVARYLAGQEFCKKAFIVSSNSGLDELDPSAGNTIFDTENGALRQIMIEREEAVEVERPALLDRETNCLIFNSIICNESGRFPYFHELVCLNAGAALCVAKRATTIGDGVLMAAELLASGAVLNKFEQCRRVYERYAD